MIIFVVKNRVAIDNILSPDNNKRINLNPFASVRIAKLKNFFPL